MSVPTQLTRRAFLAQAAIGTAAGCRPAPSTPACPPLRVSDSAATWLMGLPLAELDVVVAGAQRFVQLNPPLNVMLGTFGVLKEFGLPSRERALQATSLVCLAFRLQNAQETEGSCGKIPMVGDVALARFRKMRKRLKAAVAVERQWREQQDPNLIRLIDYALSVRGDAKHILPAEYAVGLALAGLATPEQPAPRKRSSERPAIAGRLLRRSAFDV